MGWVRALLNGALFGAVTLLVGSNLDLKSRSTRRAIAQTIALAPLHPPPVRYPHGAPSGSLYEGFHQATIWKSGIVLALAVKG